MTCVALLLVHLDGNLTALALTLLLGERAAKHCLAHDVSRAGVHVHQVVDGSATREEERVQHAASGGSQSRSQLQRKPNGETKADRATIEHDATYPEDPVVGPDLAATVRAQRDERRREASHGVDRATGQRDSHQMRHRHSVSDSERHESLTRGNSGSRLDMTTAG